jgi:RNA polymerase sigma-70 factor, ECF subfamily
LGGNAAQSLNKTSYPEFILFTYFIQVLSIRELFHSGWCIVEKASDQTEGKGRGLADEQSRVEAARRGDAAAWEQLVQAHQQGIFRLAYLMLGDADDAEDVAQETFLRAYHALDRFDASRPLRPWLAQIAANLCRNWRRSLGRYWSALQGLLRSEESRHGAVQQAEQNLESEALWKAVRRLRMEDQQVIYLRYFLDYSEAETASALGVALGTVKSRSHRALARLRAVLLDEFPTLAEEDTDAA